MRGKDESALGIRFEGQHYVMKDFPGECPQSSFSNCWKYFIADFKSEGNSVCLCVCRHHVKFQMDSGDLLLRLLAGATPSRT